MEDLLPGFQDGTDKGQRGFFFISGQEGKNNGVHDVGYSSCKQGLTSGWKNHAQHATVRKLEVCVTVCLADHILEEMLIQYPSGRPPVMHTFGAVSLGLSPALAPRGSILLAEGLVQGRGTVNSASLFLVALPELKSLMRGPP